MTIIILFIVYITGIFVYIEQVSFDSLGITLSFNNSSITPKVARRALLWPILLVLQVIRSIILMFCELLNLLFLVFGYTEYENSKFCKFINEKLK